MATQILPFLGTKALLARAALHTTRAAKTDATVDDLAAIADLFGVPAWLLLIPCPEQAPDLEAIYVSVTNAVEAN